MKKVILCCLIFTACETKKDKIVKLMEKDKKGIDYCTSLNNTYSSMYHDTSLNLNSHELEIWHEGLLESIGSCAGNKYLLECHYDSLERELKKY